MPETDQPAPSVSVAASLREQLRAATRGLENWEKKYDKNPDDLDFVKERIKFYTEQVKYLQTQLIESK